MRASTNVLVYSKLLLQTSKGAEPVNDFETPTVSIY